MNGHERLEALAAELDRLAEELADAAMDVLRSGLADESGAAAALAGRQERLVNRARLAVERAVSLLVKAAEVGDRESESPAEPPTRPRRRGWEEEEY